MRYLNISNSRVGIPSTTVGRTKYIVLQAKTPVYKYSKGFCVVVCMGVLSILGGTWRGLVEDVIDYTDDCLRLALLTKLF